MSQIRKMHGGGGWEGEWRMDSVAMGTYFERDVVISDANLQLLLSDDVLLWPVRVIFPVKKVEWSVFT